MATATLTQPRTRRYEWGGPVGAFCMVVLLPALVLALNSLCDTKQCSMAGLLQLPSLCYQTYVRALPDLPRALLLEVAWMAYHALFYLCPIGPVVMGQRIRNGQTLAYRMNAIHCFVVTHAVLLVAHYADVANLAALTDMMPALLIGSILISTGMSLVLYVASYRDSATVLTALGGNTGNAVYDFWVGRELNPRTGFLDWKFMCELRPGLIGWSVLNWAFVCKSLELGNFTPSIALIALFQSLYVMDGLLLEAGNLTMMDIVTDGFGFMLCFGDLTWVPFTYILQTKYLAYHPIELPLYHLVACVLLVGCGYVVFRGANTQKNRFRTNPSDPRLRHLRVMKTSKGKSLIVSGYWGVCRHPNYVGDWLMSLGWAALSGFGALIPYFHPIYFGSLLIHRQLRDEVQMRERYGDKDWQAFCNVVRYRLIPYVY